VEVVWSPRAEFRLVEIADYIKAHNPERAKDFVLRLLHSVDHLKEFPESGSLVPENGAFRQVILQGYRIIYRIQTDERERLARVEIVTVISPGQNALLDEIGKNNDRSELIEKQLSPEWGPDDDDDL
jgi:plasmid stabilization system protein ParE